MRPQSDKKTTNMLRLVVLLPTCLFLVPLTPSFQDNVREVFETATRASLANKKGGKKGCALL
jgi:hypothetical protein